MERLLATVPKSVIAIAAILIGFVLMRISDPPRTLCDAQMEIFKESQKKFLFSTSETGKSSLAREAYEICKNDNSPGGCFEFFEKLKKLSVDLKNIPEQCSAKAAEEAQIQTWLKKSLKLMVQMAWGERAPASYAQKNGWFDTSEIVLFCDLKKSSVRIFGAETFAEWTEEFLKSVPAADRLARDQVWQKNLLSTPCDYYR